MQGDGNVHSLFVFNNEGELEQIKDAVVSGKEYTSISFFRSSSLFQHEMVDRAIALDGTSSGEHGTGIGKVFVCVLQLLQTVTNVAPSQRIPQERIGTRYGEIDGNHQAYDGSRRSLQPREDLRRYQAYTKRVKHTRMTIYRYLPQKPIIANFDHFGREFASDPVEAYQSMQIGSTTSEG